jgi:predicted nucleic acid-binding protein
VSYFDTSLVVAYYLPEAISARAQAVYDADPRPTASELVEVEFFSALSLRVRVGDVPRDHAERAARLFLTHLDDGLYARIALNTGHYRRARDLLARFDLPLKAPDALHLAVAAAEALRLVTVDEQLARNARALGLDVELVGPT